MERLRYELDPHNRLVVRKTGEGSSVKRFRRVLDGQFKIGPGNSLIYHVKAPMEGIRPDPGAPHQLKLKGTWALTKNHDLRLTLDKWRRQVPGDELTLQGEIIAAKANSLLFSLTTRSRQDLASVYLLNLEGTWQADKHNRLIFRANKGRGRYDSLLFDGIWEMNKQHRIIYHYEKAQLTSKDRRKRSITFKGYWKIAGQNKLAYEVGLDGTSVFEFSGTWKLTKNSGLLFEVDCRQGRPRAVSFGAEVRLSGRDKVTFRLKNELGQDLSLEITLSRRLLKGAGEAFIKLLKSKKEASIYAGSVWRW